MSKILKAENAVAILENPVHWYENQLVEKFTETTYEAILILAGKKNELQWVGMALTGLKKIDEKIAKELKKFDMGLDLGLTELNSSCAKWLSKNSAGLTLDALEEIDDDVAFELSNNNTILELNGLKSLSETAASHLSNYHGHEISLNSIQNIDLQTLSSLVRKKEYGNALMICLDGLKELNQAQVDILLKHYGNQNNFGGLSLKGLTELDDKSIEALAKNKNTFELRLSSDLKISDSGSACLSKYREKIKPRYEENAGWFSWRLLDSF